MEHVEELCESICILKRGKQVAEGSIKSIKDDFKQKTIFIRGTHDVSFLKDHPGVLSYNKKNDLVTLKIEDETFAQPIYDRVTPLGYFSEFSVKDPTLNEIFISKVGEHDE